MAAPVLDRAHVRAAVERPAAAALGRAEGVAELGRGVERGLHTQELRVDRDQAPLGVGDVLLLGRLPRLLALEMLAAVEDQVQPLGARRLEALEPAAEDRQLALAAGLVAGLQELHVLGRHLSHARAGRGGLGVADPEVLAGRHVAVLEHRRPVLEPLVGEREELLDRQPSHLGAGEVRVVEVAAQAKLRGTDA